VIEQTQVNEADEGQPQLTAVLGIPICPYCKSKMGVYLYISYYDSFHYWGCNCDDLPNAHEVGGAYA